MPHPCVPHGVIPAVLLPFDSDLSIDQVAFRKHLRDVAATEGLSDRKKVSHAPSLRSSRRDSGSAVAVRLGSLDRSGSVPQASARRRGDRRPLRSEKGEPCPIPAFLTA